MPRHSPRWGFARNGWVCGWRFGQCNEVYSDCRTLAVGPKKTGETTHRREGTPKLPHIWCAKTICIFCVYVVSIFIKKFRVVWCNKIKVFWIHTNRYYTWIHSLIWSVLSFKCVKNNSSRLVWKSLPFATAFFSPLVAVIQNNILIFLWVNEKC